MARLVFLTIPTGKREAVLDILDEEGVEFTLSDETSGRDYTSAVHFPLPTNAVEPVLDRLGVAGIDDESITVTVETQTVV